MEIGDRQQQTTKPVCNLPYDESLELNDSEEIASVYTPTPRQPDTKTESRRTSRRRMRGTMATNNSSSDEFDDEEKPKQVEPINGQATLSANDDEDDDDEEEDSDEEDSDEDDDERGSALEGAYDPADYDNLPVSTEVKELFQYITRYTPQNIELDHKLKPFIPDFIPAVGDIDAFLKVPRPDGKPDNLGLLVLDEPCVKQSDPTVLSLWLSEETKQHNTTETVEKLIDLLGTLDRWIDETPPVDQPSRFGNKAYRTWYGKLDQEAEALVAALISADQRAAAPEIAVYLKEAVGNSTKIDYGTGSPPEEDTVQTPASYNFMVPKKEISMVPDMGKWKRSQSLVEDAKANGDLTAYHLCVLKRPPSIHSLLKT